MIISSGLENAFIKIQYSFMITLRKLEILRKILNMIKGIYANLTANIFSGEDQGHSF
jgi:hypothetical protein